MRYASIVQARPSEYINFTSHIHSPPDEGTRHSINSNLTLPTSKKQSQDILYRHGQAHSTTPTTRCKHYPSKPIRVHQLDIPLILCLS
uniref:Uncharacterized protein n=1 Tax=Cucumis melo TaxID=3656 RepID=A0A9I9E549_CUCME